MDIKLKESGLPKFIQDKLDFHYKDIIESTKNGKHLVLGERPKTGDIFLQSNDYLSLSNNSEIINAQVDSLLSMKESPVMSGVFLQDGESKPKIEVDLASFTGFDNCLILQSGWSANMSLLQTICTENTNIYIDFFTHMSLWEGARVVGAKIHPFMHNNMRHLERSVKRHGPGIIIVDSIYSTLGTIAPIADIVEIAKTYNCATIVDESHSLGTHGHHGAGIVESLGLSKHVNFLTASLAKSFAFRAGAVWSNNSTNSLLPFLAYPTIFSSALLPNELDRIAKTLEVIKNQDQAREKLQSNARYVVAKLRQIGFTIKSESQIIGLETGDERNTEKVRDFLEFHGVFGAIFCRPATPDNKNIMRLSLHSALSTEEIEHILRVCKMAYDQSDLYFL